MSREIKIDNDYKSALLKLIPSEIVAIYFLLIGYVPETHLKLWSILISVIILAITPFHLKTIMGVKNDKQIIITMIAFVLWLYAIGGPFAAWGLHEPWIAAIIIGLWTFLTPHFYKKKENK